MKGLLAGLLLAANLISASVFASDKQVNIYSFRQPFLINPILEEFTQQTGIKTHLIFAKKGIIQRLKREGELSPADVVLTSNFTKLLQLKHQNLTQRFSLTPEIQTRIAEQYRDSERHWLALTKRVRNVYSSKARTGNLTGLRYEDLADPEFKGKICSRSGKHPYNLGLIASMIAHHGEAQTEAWLRGVKANLARKPQGNDRAQVRAIKEGLCDLALGNSYYFGKMLKDKRQMAWADAVNLNFPNQTDRGSHINVSGVVIAKHAPNKAAAQKLIDFLAGAQAQALYAELNMEYPVNPDVEASALVRSWGDYKADTLPLEKMAQFRPQALKLVDKVGFDL